MRVRKRSCSRVMSRGKETLNRKRSAGVTWRLRSAPFEFESSGQQLQAWCACPRPPWSAVAKHVKGAHLSSGRNKPAFLLPFHRLSFQTSNPFLRLNERGSRKLWGTPTLLLGELLEPAKARLRRYPDLALVHVLQPFGAHLHTFGNASAEVVGISIL